jgi:acyl-CoA thioesterase FadM
VHEKRLEIRWSDVDAFGTTRETIAASGEPAAEAEAVLVARNREEGGSRPLSDSERAALERAG